jgi:hypothetical protein
MHEFSSASEVRQWLNRKGVEERVRVRRTMSPFTGATIFMVALAEFPTDVAVITSFGSNTPVSYGSSDDGETARRYVALEEALKGTNAFPSP